jgi:hypothetical protein
VVVRDVLATLVGEREILALADGDADLREATRTQRRVHKCHLIVRKAVRHGAVSPVQRPQKSAIGGRVARVKVAALLVQQLLHEYVLILGEVRLWGQRRGWDSREACVDLENELREGQPLIAAPAGERRLELVERVTAVEEDRVGVRCAGEGVARAVWGIERVVVLLAEEELGARCTEVSHERKRAECREAWVARCGGVQMRREGARAHLPLGTRLEAHCTAAC